MKKRFLSLLLCLGLMAAMLPGAVAADDSYKSWSQGDPSWGSISISTTKGDTKWSMATYGCYVIAINKILIYAGQQDAATFTPDVCIQALKDTGMLSASGGIYSGNYNNSFLPTYAPDLVKETSNAHGNNPWSESMAAKTIGDKINDGYYVIVCVNNKSSGNTHWMAVDRVENGKVYVMDNGGVISLYDTGKYSGVTDQIYFKYTGSGTPPKVGGTSNAESTLAITVTSGGPGEHRTQGTAFYFRGSVTSNYNITTATVQVRGEDNSAVVMEKTVKPNKKTVDILKDGLDDLKFGTLGVGNYYFWLTAQDFSGKTAEWSAHFSVGYPDTPVIDQEETRVSCRIEYYLERADAPGSYEEKPADVVILSGAVGEEVYPPAFYYDGYDVPELPPMILANEYSTERVYCDMKRYQVWLSKTDGISSVMGEGSYRVGEWVTVSAQTAQGYVFAGWSDGSAQQTYSFIMPDRTVPLTALAVSSVSPVPAGQETASGTTASGETASPAAGAYGAVTVSVSDTRSVRFDKAVVTEETFPMLLWGENALPTLQNRTYRCVTVLPDSQIWVTDKSDAGVNQTYVTPLIQWDGQEYGCDWVYEYRMYEAYLFTGTAEENFECFSTEHVYQNVTDAESWVWFVDGAEPFILRLGEAEEALPATDLAIPSNDTLRVDGVLQVPTTYKISGSNYVQLRDVAMLLNGTGAQFSVDYDAQRKAVVIVTGESYQPTGKELQGAATDSDMAIISNNEVYINGEKVALPVYKISGANYFKLRDLGETLGFNVGWSKAAGVFLETDKPYDPTN